MITDWNIRTDLFNLLHRWHHLALAFLIGAFLGWVFSLVIPSPYRAETELYIAYDGDGIYRNPDDYKNWQLGELEIYIYSDEMLEATLTALRQSDPYWETISVAEMRPALHTYWRNAGKWRLVAEWDDRLHADMLALSWGEVVVKKASVAIDLGRQAQVLADRIRALTAEEVEISASSARLGSIAQAFDAWQNSTGQAGADQPLPVLERWRLQSLAAGLADLSPAGVLLLNQFPPVDAARGQAVVWVEMAEETIAVEGAALQARQADLKTRRDGLTHEWEQAILASRNLTTDLMVERIADIAPNGYPVRISGQIALTGGILALLAWGMWGLASISRKAHS